MTPGLAGRLRAETHELHAQVERSPFMAALLKGRLDLRAYCLLLRNLQPVYAELEAGLTAHRDQPALAPLYQPRLWRAHSIADDLENLWGKAWHAELQLLEPAERYRLHLAGLSRKQPVLLGAHAYVRYLGDLSGGQLLKGIISRSLQLQDGQGLAFFDFGSPDHARVLAAEFRAGLDVLADEDGSWQALVDEARAAFATHGRLFEALAVAVRLAP